MAPLEEEESIEKTREMQIDEAQSSPEQPATSNRKRLFFGFAVTLFLLSIFPIWRWQAINQQRMLSTTNMRKVGNSLLLYMQDWDYRLPPPAEKDKNGEWVSWAHRIRPYVSNDSVYSNPSNPVEPFHSKLRHPTENRPIDTSYALNRRFWNTFSSGPFPTENLELPSETALLVEAGAMTRVSTRPVFQLGTPTAFALDLYGDTTDRVNGLIPYPESHDGQSVIVALDGHSLAAKLAHIDHTGGPHDLLYGRISYGIFNWNGGHPNGETDRPVRE